MKVGKGWEGTNLKRTREARKSREANFDERMFYCFQSSPVIFEPTEKKGFPGGKKGANNRVIEQSRGRGRGPKERKSEEGRKRGEGGRVIRRDASRQAEREGKGRTRREAFECGENEAKVIE